jgi:hypothetical protein
MSRLRKSERSEPCRDGESAKKTTKNPKTGIVSVEKKGKKKPHG